MLIFIVAVISMLLAGALMVIGIESDMVVAQAFLPIGFLLFVFSFTTMINIIFNVIFG